MSSTRRLRRITEALSRRRQVLLWLTEAQAQHPTLSAYVVWLLDQPLPHWPLVFLPAQAAAGARRTLRRLPPWDLEPAVREAHADVSLLIELVLHLNVAADDVLGPAALRCKALLTELQVLALGWDLPVVAPAPGVPDDSPGAERLARWRHALRGQVEKLAVAAASRRLLEQHYLDGHTALFPRTAEDLDIVGAAFGELAQAADAMFGPPGEGGSASEPSGQPALEDREAAIHDAAQREASRLVDWARSGALNLMGDGSGARALAARGVRAALDASDVTPRQQT